MTAAYLGETPTVVGSLMLTVDAIVTRRAPVAVAAPAVAAMLTAAVSVR